MQQMETRNAELNEKIQSLLKRQSELMIEAAVAGRHEKSNKVSDSALDGLKNQVRLYCYSFQEFCSPSLLVDRSAK